MKNASPATEETTSNGLTSLEDIGTPPDGIPSITPPNVPPAMPIIMTTQDHTSGGLNESTDKTFLIDSKNSTRLQAELSSTPGTTEEFRKRWNNAHEGQGQGWEVLSEEDYLRIILGF